MYPNRDNFKGPTIYALRNTDDPYYKILWTDINGKLSGADWKRLGDPDPLLRGVNHFNRRGDASEGSNEGYLDGHVECANANKFIY